MTVPIKNESTTTIEKLTFRIDNDKVTGHLWKFESSKGFSSQYYKLSSHEIIKNLTGKVSYTALEGTMKYKLQVINGEIIANENIINKYNSPKCTGICHGEVPPLTIVIPKPIDPLPIPPPSPPFSFILVPPPNIPPADKNLCDAIIRQKSNADFNRNLKDLLDKINLKKETGYTEDINGHFTYQSNSTFTNLSLPYNNKNIIGYMHTHLNDYEYYDETIDDEVYVKTIKMFSPADVAYFMEMVAHNPSNKTYAMMIASNGVYQLRFSGSESDIRVFNKSQIRNFDDIYKNYMKNGGNIEENFLKFVNEKMGIKGIKLYKINTNPSDFTLEFTLDNNNSISTSLCSKS